MAYGQVNVPGNAGAEAHEAKLLAQQAKEEANAARIAAESAGGTANAALEKANQAESAAGGVAGSAAEALKTANEAKAAVAGATNAANTALETANAAKSAADNAATAAKNAQDTADAVSKALTDMNSTINAVPSQNGTLTFTGSAQSPSWNGFDSEKLTMGGTTTGTNAGSYTATFTPKEGYKWSDGTTTAKSVPWAIKRASVALPAQSGALTYNGSEQSPTWTGYDAGKMTLGGTNSGTNAGSYTATFTPGSNYQWSDGTTGAKSVSWSIGKAAGSLTLDKSSLNLNISALTGTITANRAGNGTVSATSSNPAVASVSVSGNVVTVTAKTKGNVTITVSVAEGSNHKAPANKTCSVAVSLPSKTLADNTPETIQQAAQSGQAANYWSVGDKIGIAVNGTVGCLSLNSTYYAFILGFNHNESVEGGNSIHFQFGKTSGGADIAFTDSKYNSSGSDAAFRMNTTNTNSGGWNGSYMRKTICPAFLNALPAAWRNVIAACTKYSDNSGGGSDTASKVSTTSDKIWLLAEFEVHGTRSYANSAEKNYQKQYDYYKNGNSKVKNKHDASTTACHWWLRSVIATYTAHFCFVHTDGGAASTRACFSLGFAPGFKVA